ncbi:hypothetical protein M9458_005039 [Cirrhinus mrigala]|uniref:Uncharacterized protein n=1 Tax=Cirrhinus mrigala TaxID=683832 RepID=A0ABD0RVM8_CIRMR
MVESLVAVQSFNRHRQINHLLSAHESSRTDDSEPDDNQTSRPAQDGPATAADWIVVTETPAQKTETPEPKVSISTENYSGESRVPETEGSSWGDTFPSSQTPLTVMTASTDSFSTAPHGHEARGEIQYRRRNKPKRLNQSTTEMTTSVAPSTTTPSILTSSTEDTGTTLSTSADESHTSSFLTTVPSAVEQDLSSTETVKKNSSTGEEEGMIYCFTVQLI